MKTAIVLVELVHRQQLDGRDAELLQIGNLLDQAGEGARLGRRRRRMAGEAAHVQFVDDGIFQRRDERGILAPVVGPADEQAAAVGAAHAGLRR